MKRKWNLKPVDLKISVLALSALFLGACLFEGEEKKDKVTGMYTGPCVDVSGEALENADALVARANDSMVSNFQYWSEQSDWQGVGQRSPQAAVDLYDKALEAAPGHCQAVFGRAVASAAMLTQDPELDAFIQKVEGTQEPDSLYKVGSMSGLMKLSPEQAAPMLLNLTANMKRVDPPTVREVQDLIEGVVMPKLDSVIQAMETVMDYEMFAVRFSVDGDTVEIDRSEVGPGLAGLKVAKSFLTVVAGYEWEVALDGSYDWVDTLWNIRNEDFDNLSSGQERALDHFTGMFNEASPFSKMRTGWKENVQGIPALLLSAVEDAQRGLNATIEEARSGTGQDYDPWRAGGGLNGDVDTVDLQIAVEALERSKKYLTGEVPISYDKGTRVLKVNFPKLFHIDGLQGMLPHFRFLPYAEWNDTAGVDTSWMPSGYMPHSVQLEVLRSLELGDRTYGDDGVTYWNLSVYPQAGVIGSNQNYIVTYYNYDNIRPDTIATLTSDPVDPCLFSYVKEYEAGTSTEGGIQWTANRTEGSFRLSLCRDGGGFPEFADLYVTFKGPIEFTDGAGNKTMDVEDFDIIESPTDLTGKILFRDPTFGGIFPELTNNNIWDYVESLERVQARTQRICEYVMEGDYEVWKCTRILPSNPSDLDYFVYALYWGDDVL